MDYYDIFIESKEIRKDINFFYDQIVNDLIKNKIFRQYLIDRKKSIKKTYVIKNFLSDFNKTRMLFINDIIEINFFTKKDFILDQLPPTYSEYKFSKYKIKDLILHINIYLNDQELKNKMIFSDNAFLMELRKNINDINVFFYKNMSKSEELKYKYIHKKILKINYTGIPYLDRILKYIKNITDYNFESNLKEFKQILHGLKSTIYILNFQLIHSTEFFNDYGHHNQIKINRLLKALDKINYGNFFNVLSECFNHKLKEGEEIEFISNLITHFNHKYNGKEKRINDFTHDMICGKKI